MKQYQRKKSYASESDFQDLLRQLDWTIADFARYAGMHERTIHGWFGHPMAAWPVEILRQRLHMQRLEAWLKERGVVPPDLSPKPLPKFPDGRYARKRGKMVVDGKPLTEYSAWKK